MKKATLILLSLTITLTAGWWRTYGTNEYEEGNCVQETADGGYIIVGSELLKVDELGFVEWQQEISGRCVRITNDGGYLIMQSGDIVRTDSLGNILWTKGSGFENSWMDKTFDDGCIVVGFVQIVEDDQLMEVHIRLLKVDKDGNTQWDRTFEYLNLYYYGICVQQTLDSGYIVLGYKDDYAELWLLKTDTVGLVEWEKTYDAYLTSFIQQTSDGGYIITDTDGLLRVDSLGNSLWSQYYGETGNLDIVSIVQQTSDGGFIIVGYKYPYPNTEGMDLWLVKSDSVGDSIWSRIYGGDSTDQGRYVQQTSDGGYIVVGRTRSFGAGGSDIYLIKTDSLGLLAVEEPEPLPETQQGFKVVTAVGKQIVLRFANANRSQGEERSQLGIYDASGRLVDELLLDGPGTVSWGDGFSPGVYFIRETGGSSASRKVVLIK